MKSILLWAFLGIALAQQAPPGDIYVSGGGTAENPLRAFINLYQVGTEMTGDPGTDDDPKNNPELQFRLGDAAKWAGDYETAGKAYGRTLELMPDYPPAL